MNLQKKLDDTIEEQRKAVATLNALLEKEQELKQDILRRDGKIQALRELNKK